MQPRLTRSASDRMIAGVCGGLAQYFSIDPVIVRLIFVLVSLTSGIGLLIYPVLWLVMPKASEAGQPYFPNAPDEWRQRVEVVGQEAVEFGHTVEREVREALGGQSSARSGAPPTYAPGAEERFNFDPYTGRPLAQPGGAPQQRRSRSWAGIALVGLGALFAAQHFGIATDLLMPLLLIVIGVFMLLRR